MNMNRYKNSHNVLLRIVATVVASLFFINTISWAYPGATLYQSGDTLQVQSLFKPFLDIVGREHETQLRMETALVLAMV